MVAGVSQDWSWEVVRWESSLLFVILLYASRAALKPDRKLGEKGREEVAEAVWDMGTVVG